MNLKNLLCGKPGPGNPKARKAFFIFSSDGPGLDRLLAATLTCADWPPGCVEPLWVALPLVAEFNCGCAFGDTKGF